MAAVTRRSVLAGATLAGTAFALPALARGKAAPALAVYDSRLPGAAEFARTRQAAGARLLDIAHEDAKLWRACRDGFGVVPGVMIVGLTGWSDWVMLRALLREQGRSIESEQRVDMAGRSLFAWTAA